MTDETGYGQLRAALDAAHARPGIGGTVRVRMLGENAREWDVITGDHLERDGTLHIGGGIVVFPDSTVVGSDGTTSVQWRGGHGMHNGDQLARFTIGGVATTLAWNDPALATSAA